MSGSMRTSGAVVLGVVLVLAGTAAAWQEPTPEQMRERNRAALQGAGLGQQPVRRGRVIRRPVIDLEKQATQRRPGQVLPGDPPPEKFSAPMKEPMKPAAAELPKSPPPSPQAVVPPAGDRDALTGRTMKAPPSPLVPEEAAAPAPGPAAAPAPAPVEPPAAAPASAPVPAPDPAPVPDPKVEEGAAPFASAGTTDPPVAPVKVVARPVGKDPTLATSRPPALATARVGSSAVVRVEGVIGTTGVQWRVLGDQPDPWMDAPVSSALQGRIEVRTGLDAAATLRVNEQVTVRVSPLSRVLVETSVENHRTMLGISRGSVELIESAGVDGTLVRTPDLPSGMPVQPGSRVGYSAFSGMRIVAVGPSQPR